MQTLNDILIRRRDQREALYVFRNRSKDTSLSYSELFDKSSQLASMLEKQFPPCSKGIMLFPAGLDFIIAFFGLILTRIVAIPTAYPKPNRSVKNWDHILKESDADFVLCSKAQFESLRLLFTDSPLSELPWICIEEAETNITEDWVAQHVDEDDVVFLQYSSGSTGKPKGIPLTHKNVLSNLEAIRSNFGHSSSSRGVIWLPPYHDMGLIGGMLEPFYVGFPVLLFSAFQFLLRPIEWLHAISEFRATTSGGPNFAYEHCVAKISEEQKKGLDLSCWNVAFIGAEAVRPETLKRFESQFKSTGFRPKAWHPCYGLAEATLIVSGKPVGERHRELVFYHPRWDYGKVSHVERGHKHGRTLVSNGFPVCQTSVHIIGEHGSETHEDGCIGEIEVTGPSVSKIGHKTATSDFSIRTGDLGFLWERELYICGRIKEILIFRGRNYFPQDIENSIQRNHEALENNGGAALSIEQPQGENSLVIIQEIKRKFLNVDHSQVLQRIRRTLSCEYGLSAREIILVPPRTVPRTSSGKIQRIYTRCMYYDHGFKEHKIVTST